MRVFLKGDTHGSHRIGTPSIGGHLRPLDYDSGAPDLSRIGVLDNVGPDVAACVDTSDLCDFCLCSGESERKER